MLFLVFLPKCRLSVCKFNFCGDSVNQIVWIASDTQMWFEVTYIFFKFCLCRVGAEKPERFAFDKSFFHA